MRAMIACLAVYWPFDEEVTGTEDQPYLCQVWACYTC